MHPVYDNIQDKITWFIQGAAKKYTTKNFFAGFSESGGNFNVKF